MESVNILPALSCGTTPGQQDIGKVTNMRKKGSTLQYGDTDTLCPDLVSDLCPYIEMIAEFGLGDEKIISNRSER